MNLHRWYHRPSIETQKKQIENSGGRVPKICFQRMWRHVRVSHEETRLHPRMKKYSPPRKEATYHTYLALILPRLSVDGNDLRGIESASAWLRWELQPKLPRAQPPHTMQSSWSRTTCHASSQIGPLEPCIGPSTDPPPDFPSHIAPTWSLSNMAPRKWDSKVS